MPKRAKTYEEDVVASEAIPKPSYAEAPPEVKEAIDAEPPKVRKKRAPNKKKESGSIPVSAELVTSAADGVLTLSSNVYQMVRRPAPALKFDPDGRKTFTQLLGKWAEESGFELPLIWQVVIAGGMCIVPAVAAAEGERANIRAGRVLPFAVPIPQPFVPPEQRANGVKPGSASTPAPEIRSTAADSGSGQAGERQDVVDPALDQ
jgi:hypothetical protein